MNDDIKNLERILMARKSSMNLITMIDALLEMPLNANELAKILGKDYNTIRYHTEILMEDNIIEKDDKKYGALYRPSEYLLNNLDKYRYVRSQIIKKNKLEGLS